MTVHTHNASGYKNGCRCDVCREAHRADHLAYMHRTGRVRPWDKYMAEVEANYVHGSESGYSRGCRCEPCRTAATLARGERRRRAA